MKLQNMRIPSPRHSLPSRAFGGGTQIEVVAELLEAGEEKLSP